MDGVRSGGLRAIERPPLCLRGVVPSDRTNWWRGAAALPNPVRQAIAAVVSSVALLGLVRDRRIDRQLRQPRQPRQDRAAYRVSRGRAAIAAQDVAWAA